LKANGRSNTKIYYENSSCRSHRNGRRDHVKVLAERNFPVTELIPASERSVEIDFKGQKYTVVGLQTADMKADIALFSAGGDTSLEWAPKFAAAGTTVDNSSVWRMDPTKTYCSEINASELTAADKIIANPNCSTIQMVLVLALA
jgi:aspartate-semialdehyde dehydrogenase